jgi:hypothetical protein
MKKRYWAGALGGVILAGAALPALAQSSGAVRPQYKIPDGAAPAEDAPKGIPMGEGVTLFPTGNVIFGRDSNLFLTSTAARSSDFYILNPGFKVEAKGETNIYSLAYNARVGRYTSSSADNYVDSNANVQGEFVISRSSGLRLGGDFATGHDPRGSTDRGISGEPDQYRIAGPSVLWAYGANDAYGRFELQAARQQKRYTNNRATTVGSDRDTNNYATRFFVKVAPRTSFLVEYREDYYDYNLATSLQDSRERRYFAGVTWEATAATTGTIRVGQQTKHFDVSSVPNFSGSAWEANVQWTPVSYSKFDLVTSKATSESTGLGSFVLNKRYGVTWSHGWTQRFLTAVTYNRSQDDFIGAIRSDKTDALGLKLNYRLTRTVTLGGELNHTKRDSNLSQYEYKRNLYQLTLGAAL